MNKRKQEYANKQFGWSVFIDFNHDRKRATWMWIQHYAFVRLEEKVLGDDGRWYPV